MTRIMYQDPFRVKQSKHKAINQSRPVKEEWRLGPDTLFRNFFFGLFPCWIYVAVVGRGGGV